MSGILLRALDGSNPLAFLAALGTLRLLHLSRPNSGIQMGWVRQRAWHPELVGLDASEEEVCELLLGAPTAPVDNFVGSLGKNITVQREAFRTFAEGAAGEARQEDRRAADFAAAFGCDICEDKRKGRIEYTDFCFITGSGHQDFLGTIAGLAGSVSKKHLHDALFGGWGLDKGLSMRWDPQDAREYALRWNDPSSEGAFSVWGVNWLAVEALPLFPTYPTKNGLETTGFTRARRRSGPEFTWPIWVQGVALDAVRSLLALRELQAAEVNRQFLSEMGIKEVYRAQRVWLGQGANRKVSFRSARSA